MNSRFARQPFSRTATAYGILSEIQDNLRQAKINAATEEIDFGCLEELVRQTKKLERLIKSGSSDSIRDPENPRRYAAGLLRKEAQLLAVSAEVALEYAVSIDSDRLDEDKLSLRWRQHQRKLLLVDEDMNDILTALHEGITLDGNSDEADDDQVAYGS